MTVQGGMIRRGHDQKITRVVISLVAVDVMHELAGIQLSSDETFGDYTMLKATVELGVGPPVVSSPKKFRVAVLHCRRDGNRLVPARRRIELVKPGSSVAFATFGQAMQRIEPADTNCGAEPARCLLRSRRKDQELAPALLAHESDSFDSLTHRSCLRRCEP